MRSSYNVSYSGNYRRKKSGVRKLVVFLALLVIFLSVGVIGYKLLNPPSIEEKIVNQITFDESFSEGEIQTVSDAIKNQKMDIRGKITAHIDTVDDGTKINSVLDAYVAVTSVKSPKQQITKAVLALQPPKIWEGLDKTVRYGVASTLGVSGDSLSTTSSLEDLSSTDVVFIPVSELSFKVKLLALDGSYYLDSFTKGAIFRTVSFSGEFVSNLDGLVLNNLPTKESVAKVNQTGVTALTRVMMKKLDTVGDPLYFSKNIGKFLADADLTHVSNEVSFKPDCGYSNALFCSDPRFIETLKDSGVDLVELTGNHNNDLGSNFNTDTINQYHSLGIATFGGGLNTEEAGKFHVADKKGSKIAFLGYNYPDSPGGGAIAKATTAGANSFDFDRIKTDIENAKQQAQFIIVDVQYWECYAYPDGYIEFPTCDKPIGEQEAVFKRLIDLGADMVVGSSAHQPQTYELYKEKPIYYGLGNLYFDQTSWPGTERGIVLTHYFDRGRLLQTKLTPTFYDTALQTSIMDDSDAVSLLRRLQEAR